MPVGDERNSLVNRHLPVQLLGHRRPRDLPGEQPPVHASENELPPVVVGGVAAEATGLEVQRASHGAHGSARGKFTRKQRGDGQRDHMHVGHAGRFYREK